MKYYHICVNNFNIDEKLAIPEKNNLWRGKYLIL